VLVVQRAYALFGVADPDNMLKDATLTWAWSGA
jgi:hypothetical protein